MYILIITNSIIPFNHIFICINSLLLGYFAFYCWLILIKLKKQPELFMYVVDHDAGTNTGNLKGSIFCESTALNTQVYTLKACGGSEPYSYSYTLAGALAYYFQVDANTGTVTLVNSLDYESAVSICHHFVRI